MTPLELDAGLWTAMAAAICGVMVAANLLIKHDDLTLGDVIAWFRRPHVPAGTWQRLRLRLGLLRARKGTHARTVQA